VNRRTGFAVLVLAAAAGLVFAAAPAAVAATTGRVHGTARSAYSGAPLGGISAGLYNTADDSLAYEAESGADGAYDFPTVAPGDYWLLMDDVSGRYWWEFWDQAESTETATPVSITDTETVRVDPTLDPVITNWVWFSSVGLASGFTATPWVGQATKLQATAVDAPDHGAAVPPGLHVESSTDGTTWSPWTGAIAVLGSGSFAATVTPVTPEPTHFRFTWDDSEFIVGDISAPVLISPRVDLSAWSPASVKMGPYGYAFPPYYGGQVTVEAKLLDSDGLPDVVSRVVLQSSIDGIDYTDIIRTDWMDLSRGWRESNGIFTGPDGVRLAAPTVRERTYFRYRSAKPGPPGWHVSQPVVAYPRTDVSIQARPTVVRYPKPFRLFGWVREGHLGDLCIVEVQKPGSRRWSYSSARLVYQLDWGTMGAWSYRYTPKSRGTYTFRVRYAGGPTGAPSVSGAVKVRVR
jgi:hypothetical protein